MAVRPKRKNPISTRPIYLPRVPAKELASTAREAAAAGSPAIVVYADGVPAAGDMVHRLGAAGRPAAFAGDIVTALAGRPQTEVRDRVAAAAHRLAWARVRDPSKRDYRVLPLRGEADSEEARLRARSHPEYERLPSPAPATDTAYDGLEVQAAYAELLSQPERPEGVTLVVLTDRRLARWDPDGGAWQAQTVVPGQPVVVSLAGADDAVEQLGLALRD